MRRHNVDDPDLIALKGLTAGSVPEPVDAELRELSEAATPGPWEVGPEGFGIVSANPQENTRLGADSRYIVALVNWHRSVLEADLRLAPDIQIRWTPELKEIDRSRVLARVAVYLIGREERADVLLAVEPCREAEHRSSGPFWRCGPPEDAMTAPQDDPKTVWTAFAMASSSPNWRRTVAAIPSPSRTPRPQRRPP